MDLFEVDKAAKFDTKDECRQWIADRVIRFKLAMRNVQFSDGEVGLGQSKKDGRIVNTKEEGYKPDGLDEPLKKYAKPVRENGKWMAVMLYEQ